MCYNIYGVFLGSGGFTEELLMTNLKAIVVSTGTYELWETNQPGILIFQRRDLCEIMNRDIDRVAELYGTYIQRLAEKDPEMAKSATNYTLSMEPDQKSIRVIQCKSVNQSQEQEKCERELLESEYPSVKEVMQTLERKKQKNKIHAWMKKVFGL